MQIKYISRIALLLAVALTAGCHKNSEEKPTASTPASADPSSAAATNPAPTSAPASSATTPAPAQPAATGSSAAAPAPAPAPIDSSAGAATPTPDQPVAPQQAANAPAPALPEVPEGTVLSIRTNQTINVKHAEAGQSFTGTITNPIVVDGNTVIPTGSTAEGMVVQAHKRGHFKGASTLQLTLTALNINGQHYRIDTSSVTRTKKGKGKRSAAFIGGGTGLGMLIGGVATGGVGLLVGGLAGAGAGTGVAAFTGNKDVTIPAESVLNFKLAAPIHLR
ncbi:hypothetical protein H7849_19310 [Alloacidobacterium dinghuense]|uniref:Uncharacterized protein n=1 Tax=Alloacidobacterium dinghuense TaxID=2763107 RepID=A0A7G8BFA2_9BACT|nr:hypothetical protein [Alloacidobacterium dinghuense]QNI31222.1 hypothetical protein H7849_19310 [Alloacidobacterium dinghuense]